MFSAHARSIVIFLTATLKQSPLQLQNFLPSFDKGQDTGGCKKEVAVSGKWQLTAPVLRKQSMKRNYSNWIVHVPIFKEMGRAGMQAQWVKVPTTKPET